MRSALQKTSQQLLAYGGSWTLGTEPTEPAPFPEKDLHQQQQSHNHQGGDIIGIALGGWW